MVVGAVVDLLVFVLFQSGVHVNGERLHCVVEIVNDGLLIGSGRSGGQPVRPNLRGGGDNTEIDGHVQIVYQVVDVSGAGHQRVVVRLVQAVEQGVLLAEVDPVVLLFAAQPLAPGLQGHPEVSADHVVIDVVFRVLHKLTVLQVLQAQFRGRLQITVFQLRKLLIRSQQTAHQNPADEQGKQDRQKDAILFIHGYPP